MKTWPPAVTNAGVPSIGSVPPSGDAPPGAAGLRSATVVWGETSSEESKLNV